MTWYSVEFLALEAALDSAADPFGFCDPIDGDGKRSRPHVYASALHLIGNTLVGGGHDIVQAGIHLFFVPAKHLDVLHPFEIGNRDASGVGKDVRHDADAPFIKNGMAP